MADKIDQLKVKDANGNDQVYDIDLPPNAEPNIISLTASGLANVAGLVQTGEDAGKIIASDNSAVPANWSLIAGSGITFQGSIPTIVNGTTPPSQCASASQNGYLHDYYQIDAGTGGYSEFSFNDSGSAHLQIASGYIYVGTLGKDTAYTKSVDISNQT
jgi:hypothetical protein